MIWSKLLRKYEDKVRAKFWHQRVTVPVGDLASMLCVIRAAEALARKPDSSILRAELIKAVSYLDEYKGPTSAPTLL